MTMATPGAFVAKGPNITQFQNLLLWLLISNVVQLVDGSRVGLVENNGIVLAFPLLREVAEPMVLQDVVLLLEGYGNASEYFICHTRDDLTNQSFSGLQNKDGVVPYEFKLRKEFRITEMTPDSTVALLIPFLKAASIVRRFRVFIALCGSAEDLYGAAYRSFARSLNFLVQATHTTLNRILETKQLWTLFTLRQELNQLFDHLHFLNDIFSHSILPMAEFSGVDMSFSQMQPTAAHRASHLLTALYGFLDKTRCGDQRRFQISAWLFTRSLKMYLLMVDNWLEFADTSPPESFIEKDTTISVWSDIYWSSKYTVTRPDRSELRKSIPSFMDSIADIILTTGKSTELMRHISLGQQSSSGGAEAMSPFALEQFSRVAELPKVSELFVAAMNEYIGKTRAMEDRGDEVDPVAQPQQAETPLANHQKASTLDWTLPEPTIPFTSVEHEYFLPRQRPRFDDVPVIPAGRPLQLDVEPFTVDALMGINVLDLVASGAPASSIIKHVLINPLVKHCNTINAIATKVIIKHHKVLKHLNAVRQFFLLRNGFVSSSFYLELFDALRAGSWQHVGAVNMILQQAIDLGAKEIYGSNLVSVRFSKNVDQEGVALKSLHDVHKVRFQYQVDWPINFVLNSAAIESYNKLLSLLLRINRAKYVLQGIFLHQSKNTRDRRNMTGYHRQIHFVARKFLHFVSAFQNHIVDRVISVVCEEFEKKVVECAGLQDVIKLHATFIQTLLDRCFLNHKRFRDSVNSILDMTMVIYDSHEPLTSQLTSDKVHQELSRRLDELDAKFTKHQAFLMLVGSKMDETQMPFMEDFIMRLNFNGYYEQAD